MLQSISDQGRKISKEDIAYLEGEIGHKFPSEYMRFLLDYNGGMPQPDCHDVQNTEGTNIGSFVGIHVFYSIAGVEAKSSDQEDDYTIEWSYSTYQGRIPENFLPIGEDAGGNQICLSLNGEDRGSVWYWDHEAEIAPPSYRNCYKIADSFQTLLDGLFEYDYENHKRIS